MCTISVESLPSSTTLDVAANTKFEMRWVERPGNWLGLTASGALEKENETKRIIIWLKPAEELLVCSFSRDCGDEVVERSV